MGSVYDMKILKTVFYCILLMLVTSCSSNSEDLINENVESYLIPSESAELGDAKADKNENITPMPAYDDLPEVTIDTIFFDEIPFRTFEEFMEQNPSDNTPYKCQWEKTEGGKFGEGQEAVNNLYAVSEADFFMGDISKAQKMTDWE